MITGQITSAREAVISVVVSGPAGQESTVDAVLDTGFTNEITLPPEVISELGLEFIDEAGYLLADGQLAYLRGYAASVDWHGNRHEVLVTETPGGSLIGMALLDGSDVFMRVAPGGAVRIEAISE